MDSDNIVKEIEISDEELARLISSRLGVDVSLNDFLVNIQPSGNDFNYGEASQLIEYTIYSDQDILNDTQFAGQLRSQNSILDGTLFPSSDPLGVLISQNQFSINGVGVLQTDSEFQITSMNINNTVNLKNDAIFFDIPTSSLEPNIAPIAEDDSVSTNEDMSVTFSPLVNDSDANGDTLSLTLDTTVTYGVLTLNGDASITYTPNNGFYGSDSFSYSISDGSGGRDSASVMIEVIEDIDPASTQLTNGDDVFNGAAHTQVNIHGLDGDDFLTAHNQYDTLNGGKGNDTIYTGKGNDLAIGGEGDDLINGGNHNDIIIGGSGNNQLYGGRHHDIFKFVSKESYDTFYDFGFEGDALDITEILDGYDSITESIADFVQFTDDGTDSRMKIDYDGLENGTNFVEIALFDNTLGLDALTMEGDGRLITM